LPAELIRIEGNDREIILRIVEWKYHQVKRMLEAVWNKVIKLHRSAIGDRNLEGLKEWEWRYL
jgi:16S rRNA pseudouridine516 synthase